MKRIGILTGGGDCPGLNGAIRAVVRRGVGAHGYEALGFRNGWRGVMEGDVVPLTADSVRGI
ncbi:MAG: 6-phosphofructokinase, partial [bacterium]